MTRDLASVLTELIELLRHCGEKGPADWLDKRRHDLMRARSDDERARIKAEIRGVIAGMGGISDLGLAPPPGSHLTRQEAHRRLASLSVDLDRATSA